MACVKKVKGMSKTINVKVRNKIATAPIDVSYICGNSDFIVAFDFDEEWEAYDVKTARFVYNGTYQDVIFIGNQCAVPIISDTYNIQLGIFANNLSTTTAAWIPAKKSVLCGTGGLPEKPTDDVYAQIIELLEGISATSGATPATKEKLGIIQVGENLKITEGGVLSVDTTNEANEDNTKPITSAGVFTQVGNIEVLLAAL